MNLKNLIAQKFEEIEPRCVQSPQSEDESLRSDLQNFISEIKKRKQNELNILSKIEVFLNENIGQKDADIDSLLNIFLAKTEQNFLYQKGLHFYEKGQKLSDVLSEEIYGQNDYFKSTFSVINSSHYAFILPPMVSKRTQKSYLGNSKFVRYTIKNLIKNQSKTSKINIIKSPVLVFIHHIKDSNFIPDADNLDVKSAIDTLQNIIIENDTLTDIMLIQFGVFSQSEYTEFHIMGRRSCEGWLKNNKNINSFFNHK